MTKNTMRIQVAAAAVAILLLPGGLRAQEPDPAILDSLRVRIEEVSRRQIEEVRRVQEASQAEMAALRSALEAERSRITEAQRALTEAERALAAAQGAGSPASRTAQMYEPMFQTYATTRAEYLFPGRNSATAQTADERDLSATTRAEYLLPGRNYTMGAVSNSFVTFAGDNLGGARLLTLNPTLAAYFTVEEGVLIVEVAAETPAARSGLRSGDVILGVAGTEVAEIQGISRVLGELQFQRLQEVQGDRSAQERRAGVVNLVSGSLTYPLPVRIVREGRGMEIVLEP